MKIINPSSQCSLTPRLIASMLGLSVVCFPVIAWMTSCKQQHSPSPSASMNSTDFALDEVIVGVVIEHASRYSRHFHVIEPAYQRPARNAVTQDEGEMLIARIAKEELPSLFASLHELGLTQDQQSTFNFMPAVEGTFPGYAPPALIARLAMDNSRTFDSGSVRIFWQEESDSLVPWAIVVMLGGTLDKVEIREPF